MRWQLVAAPALSASASSSVGSFGGFEGSGVPAPAPTPFGFTAPTPVPPSAAFAGFGVSPSSPATTSAATTSTVVEPPFGAPTPAPAPFGATAALPVSPSAGLADFGALPFPPVITINPSTFIEPPSDDAYAVGCYGRSYPGWQRMTVEEFKVQAAAVVEAHTRGQGLHVMDAHTELRSSIDAAVLCFDTKKHARSEVAGVLRVYKSSAGRAQCQWENLTTGRCRITRWLESPPSPEQVTQLSVQPVETTPPARSATLFVRGVRSALFQLTTMLLE
jgi:hypothetical protein